MQIQQLIVVGKLKQKDQNKNVSKVTDNNEQAEQIVVTCMYLQ